MGKRKSSLVVAGEMTIYGAAELKSRLMNAIKQTPDLEIDLSSVSAIDSAGLQILYLAKREATRMKHSMRIVAHSEPVRELLDLYNLVAYFGDPLLIQAREHKAT